MNQYPKGSRLILQLICNDCKILEKNIISKFKELYIQRTDIGTEYFEGNVDNMIDNIFILKKEEKCKFYFIPIFICNVLLYINIIKSFFKLSYSTSSEICFLYY